MNANLDATASSSTGQGRTPAWFWAAAGFGTFWNVYGAFQFSQAVMATRESLVAMGMTDAQAQTMSSYPGWMTVAFAIGTLGGLLGSVLLLVRRKVATPVLLASLAGYIILYIGDITEGVFAAIGASQIIILSVVVLIAAGLLWVSRHGEARGILA